MFKSGHLADLLVPALYLVVQPVEELFILELVVREIAEGNVCAFFGSRVELNFYFRVNRELNFRDLSILACKRKV